LHIYTDKLTLRSCYGHEAEKEQQIWILMFRQYDWQCDTSRTCLQLMYTRIYSANNFNTHRKYFADLYLQYLLSIRSKNHYLQQKSFGLFLEF